VFYLQSNKKVAIIEKDDRVGKKILVTGNGRCNLSNKNIDSSKYNDKKVMDYFDKFNETKTISFFNKIGVEVYSDEEGRLYPITNMASSVCDCLRKSIKDNVQIFTSQNVIDIKKLSDIYFIKTDSEKFEAKNLVVACGGGTQNLLKNFDISYTQNYSSLLPLKCDKSFVKNLKWYKNSCKIKIGS
jgi:predicted Rossmann fold flavoprotein